jgi:hypothetical protein
MFEGVRDEELEETLLRYIDMPYFRNNPSYIALWQRYYMRRPDPCVLFLMRHKKISQYYHWLYIELSSFFSLRRHHGISRVVLEAGIEANAYDPEVLREELGKIPADDRTYSEHEINVLLNPKNFGCLGKVWNAYNEVLFCERELLIRDGEEMSFEEHRALSAVVPSAIDEEDVCKRVKIDRDARTGELVEDVLQPTDDGELDDRLLSNIRSSIHCSIADGPAALSLDNTEQANKEKMEKPDPPSSGATSREMGPLPEKAMENMSNREIVSLNEGATVPQSNKAESTITGRLEAGGELRMEGFIYYVKERMGESTYKIMRIARAGQENMTIDAKDFVLQRTTREKMEMMKRMESSFMPEYTVKSYGDELFIKTAFYSFGSLEAILSDGTEPPVVFYIAEQLVQIFDALRLSNCSFREFRPSGICADDDLNLRIVDYDWVECTAPDSCYGPLFGYLSACSVDPVFRSISGDNALSVIRDKLSRMNVRPALIRLRMELYERICEE